MVVCGLSVASCLLTWLTRLTSSQDDGLKMQISLSFEMDTLKVQQCKKLTCDLMHVLIGMERKEAFRLVRIIRPRSLTLYSTVDSQVKEASGSQQVLNPL